MGLTGFSLNAISPESSVGFSEPGETNLSIIRCKVTSGLVGFCFKEASKLLESTCEGWSEACTGGLLALAASPIDLPD